MGASPKSLEIPRLEAEQPQRVGCPDADHGALIFRNSGNFSGVTEHLLSYRTNTGRFSASSAACM
jgi:hypothetical protein